MAAKRMKILNQLKYGITAEGRVGVEIKPTGNNPKNRAWVTILMRNRSDIGNLSYEVEYIELEERYDDETDGYDWDLFLVKTEVYDAIKDEVGLENILKKWQIDLNDLKPIAAINHHQF